MGLIYSANIYGLEVIFSLITKKIVKSLSSIGKPEQDTRGINEKAEQLDIAAFVKIVLEYTFVVEYYGILFIQVLVRTCECETANE